MPVSQKQFEPRFQPVSRKPLENAVKDYRPRQPNGGGVSYDDDWEAGIVCQDKGTCKGNCNAMNQGRGSVRL